MKLMLTITCTTVFLVCSLSSWWC